MSLEMKKTTTEILHKNMIKLKLFNEVNYE